MDVTITRGPNAGQQNRIAVCTYQGLNGTAKRISPNPKVATALLNQWLNGRIVKADVVPYHAKIARPDGTFVEGDFNRRNVMCFEDETLEQAIIASGHQPSAVHIEPLKTVAGVTDEQLLKEQGIDYNPGAAADQTKVAEVGGQRQA